MGKDRWRKLVISKKETIWNSLKEESNSRSDIKVCETNQKNQKEDD